MVIISVGILLGSLAQLITLPLVIGMLVLPLAKIFSIGLEAGIKIIVRIGNVFEKVVLGNGKHHSHERSDFEYMETVVKVFHTADV